MNAYNLSFIEAIEKCLTEKVFIRGEGFAKGFYIKNQNDVLVMVDGNNTFHEVVYNMIISGGAVKQKYKAFIVANKQEIELE
ncbi:hypothetical protein [Paenibacillus elgii]|uniref:hypothetical protein n=1 Tax=Paenibacillus elgii TaxID=189691 RepID=UPI000248C6CE|nr:hypothetical protein [Paenibacillus elgii]